MQRAVMGLMSPKEAWQSVVAPKDRGLQLVLPSWSAGCCSPRASRARSHTGDHACGRLGRSRVLWGLQHCGRDQETGFPKKEATPPAAGLGSGDSRMVGDGFPRKRTAASLVFVGWQKALPWGLQETGP